MAIFFSTSSVGEKVLCDPFPSAATAMLQLNDEKEADNKKAPPPQPQPPAPSPKSKSGKEAPPPANGSVDKASGPIQHVNPQWGRFNGGTWLGAIGCGAIIAICPVLVILLQIALFHFDGSIVQVLRVLVAAGPLDFAAAYAPAYSQQAALGYVAWVLFQVVLYMGLPSKICYGQQTPAGNLLPYHINGLSAWAVSHVAYAAGSYYGVLDPAIIARHWEGLVVAFNMYGFLLPLIAYIKAHLAPTHGEDRKFSGSMIYDYYMGIEFNPRIGKWFDFKLFHNGRPGIVMWTMM